MGTLDELPVNQYARRRSALSVPPFFSCFCVLIHTELHDEILNHSVSVPTMQRILIMAWLVRTVNSMKSIFLHMVLRLFIQQPQASEQAGRMCMILFDELYGTQYTRRRTAS